MTSFPGSILCLESGDSFYSFGLLSKATKVTKASVLISGNVCASPGTVLRVPVTFSVNSEVETRLSDDPGHDSRLRWITVIQ